MVKVELKSRTLKTFAKKVAYEPLVATLLLKEEIETEIIRWKKNRLVDQIA